MTLVRVDVTTSRGGLLSLPLADASSGYQVREIGGLDPVKATIVTSSFAQQDGSMYQSSRRESRDISFKIGIAPAWATDNVSTLRSRLYAFFMPKTAVTLKFYFADGNYYQISGRVESCETSMFSQDQVVDISVMCFDPDFVDPDTITVSGSTTSGSTVISLPYNGSVETGVVFTLSLNRALTQFTIYHQPPDGILRTMEFSANMLSGDKIEIGTNPGSKYAVLTRANVQSPILYGVSPQSHWVELTPGTNGIRVYATGAAIPYTIKYTARYGGL